MRRIAMIAGCLLLLSGCAQGANYSDEVAASLQERVVAVSEAAAASDFAAAQARLAELRAATDDALARGELSEERHRSITSAADLVAADLEAELAEAKRVADEAAAAAEAARIAEEEAADEDNSGPGKGKDKDEDEDD